MYNEISIREVKDRVISVNQSVNTKWNYTIQSFVDAMQQKDQSADFYVKNRNANAKTVADNIFLGKKGELFAASALLKYHKFPKIKLDFDIRVNGGKGWDCDLPYGTTFGDLFPNVHVKTCDKRTVDIIDDYTWTFQHGNLQKNNKFGQDDVFQKKHNSDLVILVYLENMMDHKAVIKSILPFNEVKFYFKDPKFSKFKGLKKCIYYNDLKSINLSSEVEISLEEAMAKTLSNENSRNPFPFLRSGFRL
jgi:hypothetical protein